jgi:hypothetical protein
MDNLMRVTSEVSYAVNGEDFEDALGALATVMADTLLDHSECAETRQRIVADFAAALSRMVSDSRVKH